jgi:LPXTG-site transpeptidase (sortase) family protein
MLVAAAAALLATTPLQLGDPSQRSGIPDGTTATVPMTSTASVAPAPPQSFSRPAQDSTPSVPGSPPVLVEAPVIGLHAAVTPWSDEQVAAHDGAVTPSTLWEVAWWTGGGMPASHADNTVYLYGHTWTAPAVFNRVTELGRGDTVLVTTRTGRLEYVVEQTFTVAKPALDDHPLVREAHPGRLLLIGCYRATGREEHTTRNVVVVAHLR